MHLRTKSMKKVDEIFSKWLRCQLCGWPSPESEQNDSSDTVHVHLGEVQDLGKMALTSILYQRNYVEEMQDHLCLIALICNLPHTSPFILNPSARLTRSRTSKKEIAAQRRKIGTLDYFVSQLHNCNYTYKSSAHAIPNWSFSICRIYKSR
jgi:hypothetical protein